MLRVDCARHDAQAGFKRAPRSLLGAKRERIRLVKILFRFKSPQIIDDQFAHGLVGHVVPGKEWTE